VRKLSQILGDVNDSRMKRATKKCIFVEKKETRENQKVDYLC
jgi:hypothetical protein